MPHAEDLLSFFHRIKFFTYFMKKVISCENWLYSWCWDDLGKRVVPHSLIPMPLISLRIKTANSYDPAGVENIKRYDISKEIEINDWQRVLCTAKAGTI